MGVTLTYTVRIPGEFGSVEELKTIVVKHVNGQSVYLQDLADIEFGFKEQLSYSRLNSQPSVTISILKRSGENVINISEEVKAIRVETVYETFLLTIHILFCNICTKCI